MLTSNAIPLDARGRGRERWKGSTVAERNQKGQFVKGNKASPGRPPRPTESAYIDKMYAVGDLETWGKATKKMLDLAVNGDVQAWRSVAPYYAGLPVQKLQISSQDAALLAQVLELLKTRGLSASDVFGAMIAQLAESEPADVYEDSENESG